MFLKRYLAKFDTTLERAFQYFCPHTVCQAVLAIISVGEGTLAIRLYAVEF